MFLLKAQLSVLQVASEIYRKENPVKYSVIRQPCLPYYLKVILTGFPVLILPGVSCAPRATPAILGKLKSLGSKSYLSLIFIVPSSFCFYHIPPIVAVKDLGNSLSLSSTDVPLLG